MTGARRTDDPSARAVSAGLSSGRWILLRGLAREAAHWGPFLNSWRAHLPATELLTPDLPGCGLHHQDISPSSVPEILESVRAEIGSANLGATKSGRPTALLAMSLGAMVACEWMRRYPEEVDGLVLINGSVGGLSPPWRRLRWFGVSSMARALLASRTEAREAYILAMVSAAAPFGGQARQGPRDTDAPLGGTTNHRNDGQRAGRTGELSVAAQWCEIAARRPVTRLNAIRQLVAAARFRPALVPSDKPSLVLASLQDRMVNPVCSRQLAARIGAELREHPDAGHDLPLDAPDWVAAHVARWAKAK